MQQEKDIQERTSQQGANKSTTNIPLIAALILAFAAYGPLFIPISGSSPFNMFGLSFLAGIWAILLLAARGYGGTVPFIIWVLFGWNVILVLLVGFGPFMLLVASFFPNKNANKKDCMHCKEKIAIEATRCPKCQGDLAIAEAVV